MKNINEDYFDNREKISKKESVIDMSKMTREEKIAYIEKFIVEKNKNIKRPSQEDVLAEMNSLRGHYYIDKDGNFLLKNGRDMYD